MSLSNLIWRRPGSTARSSDEQLIRGLVRDYYPFIWRVLLRVGVSAAEVDDAAQQVFIVAARSASEVPPERIRSFLYGTALRVASNHRRTVRRRREQLHDSESSASTACLCSTADDRVAHDPERCAELSRACSLLDELLAALPDPLRRVLVLAEIEQLEVAEIAALERIPSGTAASRLRRARSQFSVLLQRNAHRNPFGRPA